MSHKPIRSLNKTTTKEAEEDFKYEIPKANQKKELRTALSGSASSDNNSIKLLMAKWSLY